MEYSPDPRFVRCRDCGWWGHRDHLVAHSENPDIGACPNCGSGIHVDKGPKIDPIIFTDGSDGSRRPEFID